MKTEALLEKVHSATQVTDIFTHFNYKKEYLDYVRKLHPDVCSLSGATEALEKLNHYRSQMDAMRTVQDDAGSLHSRDACTFIQTGDTALLAHSQANYQQLMQLPDKAAVHFRKYLPASIERLDEQTWAVTTTHPALPLTHLTLSEEHVSWVLSRILELVSWFHQAGFVHAGIHPESIAIVPETHGIVCLSFYHIKPINSRLDSISARYMDWYPQITFDQKQALEYIDLCLAQRTALYLLGDKSGNGIRLKATHDTRLIDFLITPHYEAYDTYDTYRNLLRTVFGKPTFHALKV